MNRIGIPVWSIANDGALTVCVGFAEHHVRSEALNKTPHVFIHPRHTGCRMLKPNTSHQSVLGQKPEIRRMTWNVSFFNFSF
jgi:hypothetical protein